MSPTDLSDSELIALLGRAPTPEAPAADLAQRIVERAAATPQTRSRRFAGSPRRKFRRHPIVWSAFIAANALAAAAAAASWDGARFDFNRLADLPHRVAASIHLPHRYHHESKALRQPGARLEAPSPKIAMHSTPMAVVPRASRPTPMALKVSPENVALNPAQTGHHREHLADRGRGVSVRKAFEPRPNGLNRKDRLSDTRRPIDLAAQVQKRSQPAVSAEPLRDETSRPSPEWRKLTPEERWKRHMSAVDRPGSNGTRTAAPGYPDARWNSPAAPGNDRRLSARRSARGTRWKFRQPRRAHPNGRRFRFNRRR